VALLQDSVGAFGRVRGGGRSGAGDTAASTARVWPFSVMVRIK
jgi:hypothetical protein